MLFIIQKDKYTYVYYPLILELYIVVYFLLFTNVIVLIFLKKACHYGIEEEDIIVYYQCIILYSISL